MAITRSDLAGYLSATYGSLLAEAGIAANDGTGGLKEPIDDALLAVGVPWAALTTGTVADANARALLAIVRYYALDRIYSAVLDRVDITVDGPSMSKSRSQMVKQLEKSLAEARKDAERHGLNVSRTGIGVLIPVAVPFSEWS